MDNQNDVNQQSQVTQQSPKQGNGLGVAALVVGIIAILGSWIPFLNVFSIILGFIALGLAIGGLVVSKKNNRPKGTSIAGLVLSILTILIFFAVYQGANEAIKNIDSETVGAIVEKEIAKTDDKQEQKAADITISAEELSQAYADNEVKADSLYKGKTALITGTISDIGVILGQTYIVFDSTANYGLNSVQANFSNKDEIAKIANLNNGDTITIQGKIDGMSMYVEVDNCVIK